MNQKFRRNESTYRPLCHADKLERLVFFLRVFIFEIPAHFGVF